MQEGWNLTPIIIPLVALLIGWAIGFFDSNLRTSKKIKEAEESAQKAIRAAEAGFTEAQARYVHVAQAGAPDDPGLMRIKNESGLLTLDLDGTRVNPSALTIDQRKRLIEMLNAMRPWLEGKPATPPAALSTPPTAPMPAAAREKTAPAPTVPPPQTAKQAPVSASKPVPTARTKAEEPELAPTSIVGQINQILQAQIDNTPLESKGVSLMESPSGGVNVYVGVQRYEAIDDVPDEEVKAAIRAAIAEWERKYTPGL